MKFIQEKKNAILILILGIIFGPGTLFLYRNIYDTYIGVYLEKIVPFLLFSGIVYVMCAIFFLFFYENILIKKWVRFSFIFILLTIPTYLYINTLKPDAYNVLAMIPNMFIYLVLFISTPFYLHYQAKKLKK